MKTTEAAKILGVSQATVRAAVRREEAALRTGRDGLPDHIAVVALWGNAFADALQAIESASPLVAQAQILAQVQHGIATPAVEEVHTAGGRLSLLVVTLGLPYLSAAARRAVIPDREQPRLLAI